MDESGEGFQNPSIFVEIPSHAIQNCFTVSCIYLFIDLLFARRSTGGPYRNSVYTELQYAGKNRNGINPSFRVGLAGDRNKC
jgi:hypothetical protein